MKNYTLLTAMLLLLSCSKKENVTSRRIPERMSVATMAPVSGKSAMRERYSSYYKHLVSLEDANRMIKSYLNGIGYPQNQSAIRSWTLDADALRSFICEGNGAEMSKIKLMLAHTMEYTNAGNEGKSSMDKGDALTLIIVGVDEENNYIYSPEGDVLDFCQPCPTQCLETGDAANDLLTQRTDPKNL